MEQLFKQIVVIFEDEDVLVINKPAGLSVHSDGKSNEKTLVDWIIKTYPQAQDVGEDIELEDGVVVKRSGIVHRIDKETSGLLMIAKNQESFEYFKDEFKQRNIKKTYFTFVKGTPKDSRGIITFPIGRSSTDIRKWATGKNARGEMRDASTRYKVHKSVSGFSFLEVWPQTGRTHQIRVHLSAIGHPIVADLLYGQGRQNPLGFKRLALHASRLVFINQNRKEVVLEAPFPEDFERAIDQYKINLPK